MTTVGTSSVPCLASDPSRGHSGDVLAIVAPGQGAQKPGFLSDWMSDATFSDHLAWLSAVADIDLVTQWHDFRRGNHQGHCGCPATAGRRRAGHSLVS